MEKLKLEQDVTGEGEDTTTKKKDVARLLKVSQRFLTAPKETYRTGSWFFFCTAELLHNFVIQGRTEYWNMYFVKNISFIDEQ